MNITPSNPVRNHVTKCDVCDEPREPHTPGWSSCELEKIVARAKEGCATCSLVKESIDQYVTKDKLPERVVLRWWSSGGKSFEMRLNDMMISYYIAEGMWLFYKSVAVIFTKCILKSAIIYFIRIYSESLAALTCLLLRYSFSVKHFAIMADWA